MTFALGQPVNLASNVYDTSGVLANATGVTLTISLPDGTSSNPTVSNPPTVTGKYVAAYIPTQSGHHGVRWLFTGTNASAPPLDSFDVDSDLVFPIVSMADVKDHLGSAVAVGDLELAAMRASVEAAVEAYTGRVWTRRTVIETRDGGDPVIVLRSGPVLSVTSVVEDGTTLAAGDYVLDATASLLYRGSTTSRQAWAVGVQNVVITLVAGAAAVPGDVRLAVLRGIEYAWERSQTAPHPALGEGGGFDEFAPAPSHVLPYAVTSLLDPHRAVGIA